MLNKRASESDLENCRRDPSLANQLRRDLVVCLECGDMVARLVPSRCHAQYAHGLNRAAYLQKWPGAPLASIEAEEADRKARQAYKKGHRPEINAQRRVRFQEIKETAAVDLDSTEAQFLKKEHERSSTTWKRNYWGNGPNDNEAADFRRRESERRKARHSEKENEARRARYWVNLEESRSKNAAKQRLRTAKIHAAERGVEEVRKELAKREAHLEELKLKLGRPRKHQGEVIKYGPRVTKLKTQKSWGQLTTMMNRETGKNQSKSYWRHIWDDYHIPAPANAS
jgi:hypothetical protein